MTSRRSRFQVKPNTRSGPISGLKGAVNNKNDKVKDSNSDSIAGTFEQGDKNLSESFTTEASSDTSSLKEKSTNENAKTNLNTESKISGGNIDDKANNNNSPTDRNLPSTNQLTLKSSDTLQKKNETATTVSSIKPPTCRLRLLKPKPKIVSRTINNQANKNDTRTSKFENKTLMKDNILTNSISNVHNRSSISENVELTYSESESLNASNKIVDTSIDPVNVINNLNEPVASTSEVREDRTCTITAIPVNKPLHLLDPIKPRKKPIRRFKPGSTPPEKNKMKMVDLIFWNPLGKGMSKKNTEQPITNNQNEPVTENEKDEEDSVDNPNEGKEETATTSSADTNSVIPGPRVMIGEDGQIIIDESSLIIEQTNAGNDISTQEIVYDSTDTTYASFKKPKDKINHFWTLKETAKFYKTLSIVGTDFTLMSTLFPERSRLDLKNKFKKEERLRKVLIDKAISEWHNFDLNDIENFLAEEEVEKGIDPPEKAKKRKKRVDDDNEEEDFNDSPPLKRHKISKKPARKPKNSKKDAKENLDGHSEISVPLQKKNKRPHNLSPSLSASTVDLYNRSRDNTPSPTKRAETFANSCDKSNNSEATVLRISPSEDADSNKDSLNSPSAVFKEPSNSSQNKVTNVVESTTSPVTNNQLSNSHPTLHSLLNKSQNQTPSSAGNTTTANINLPVGQLILVASRTPTNEQVVHVYLVSPNGQSGAALQNAAGTSQSGQSNQNRPISATPESPGNAVAPSTSKEDSSVELSQTNATKSNENKSLGALGIVKLKSP